MVDTASSKSAAERRHTLTLGCTGMLSDAARGLERDGYAVSYLCRSGRLPDGSGGKAYSCDWAQETSIRRAAHEAIEESGVSEIVLAWSHSVGQVLSLARAMSSPAQSIRFHHVLGSSVNDPKRKDALARIRLSFSDLPGIDWHAVCLGFVREGKTSRWLTHEEISGGALSAIRLKTPVYTIGQTAPWKFRPE